MGYEVKIYKCNRCQDQGWFLTWRNKIKTCNYCISGKTLFLLNNCNRIFENAMALLDATQKTNYDE